jgi:hypothetical protein
LTPDILVARLERFGLVLAVQEESIASDTAAQRCVEHQPHIFEFGSSTIGLIAWN